MNLLEVQISSNDERLRLGHGYPLCWNVSSNISGRQFGPQDSPENISKQQPEGFDEVSVERLQQYVQEAKADETDEPSH